MWSADVGWGELFKAEGMPTQAPAMGMCLVCSRGSKKAWKGGLEESRTVKPENLTPVPSLSGTPIPAPATPLVA